MKLFPLRIIQLSVLFVCVFGATSCNKDHDLMAEYVVTDSLGPQVLGMSQSDTQDGLVSKTTNPGTHRFTGTIVPIQVTVAVDHTTNTLVYTSEATNRLTAANVVKTPAK